MCKSPEEAAELQAAFDAYFYLVVTCHALIIAYHTVKCMWAATGELHRVEAALAAREQEKKD